MSLLGDLGRTIDHATRSVSRAVKSIPVVGNVVHATEDVLKGPIGTTIHSVLANPIVQTAFGPVTLPYQLAIAGASGGVQGATDDAKAALRNPVRRAAVKAVALVFPPALPAAAALEAANHALDAVESGDPVQIAKAAAQLGATEALAGEGDSDARRALELVNQAKAARTYVPQFDVHHLTSMFMGDHAARVVQANTNQVPRPALVRNALNVLHVATSAPKGTPPAVDQAKIADASRIVGVALAHGVAHPGVPAFVHLAADTHRTLQSILGRNNPIAKTIANAVEDHAMAGTLNRSQSLNQLVLAANSTNPTQRAAADAQMARMRTAAAHDPAARAALDDVRRRAAALRTARQYHIDAKGYARHVHAAPPQRAGLH